MTNNKIINHLKSIIYDTRYPDRGENCTCEAWTQLDCCCGADWRVPAERMIERIKKEILKESK